MLSKYKEFNHFLNNRAQCFSNLLLNKNIKHLTTDNVSETHIPPKDARVVVCGGGVMGAAVAYHLSKLGWGSDTVLIDQSR